MRFRHEVGSTLVAQTVAFILSGITLTLVSRWLGPEGKGIQATVITAGQLVATFGSLGLAGSVPYFVSPAPQRAVAALRNGTTLLAAATVIAIGLAIGARFVPGGLELEGHEVVFIALVVTTFGQLYGLAMLLALREIALFNGLVLADSVAALAGTIVVQLIAPASVDGFILVQALAMAVAATGAFARVRARTRGIPQHDLPLGAQLRVSFLGFLSGAFVQLSTRADLFIVIAIGGGLVAGGVYSVAVAASEVFLRAPQWIAQLLAPRVARAAIVRTATARLSLLAVGAGAVTMLFVVVLAGPIESLFQAVLGAGFVPAYAAMVAIFPRIVFQSGATILAAEFAGRGYTIVHPAATFGGLFVTLGVDLTLVPTLGPVGAGVGASAGALVTLAIFVLAFARVPRGPDHESSIPVRSSDE